MKLVAMVLLVSISAACVEGQPEPGTASAALCSGPQTAAGPLPGLNTYKPGFVLPVSTVSQVWLLVPMVSQPDANGWYATYQLMLVDPDTRLVLSRATVSKANRLSALTAAHGRLGTVIEFRGPTNPPWPPVNEGLLASWAITAGLNARNATNL